jgi:hypothetical protein
VGHAVLTHAADEIVVAGQGDQARHGVLRIGVIGIHDHDEPAACRPKARAHRRPLALLTPVSEQATGIAGGNGCRIIGRGIIHHDDFIALGEGQVKDHQESREHRGQRRSLVVGGQDNRGRDGVGCRRGLTGGSGCAVYVHVRRNGCGHRPSPTIRGPSPRAQAHDRLSQRFHGPSMAKVGQDRVESAVEIRLRPTLRTG